jgi:hypothetical protein
VRYTSSSLAGVFACFDSFFPVGYKLRGWGRYSGVCDSLFISFGDILYSGQKI